MEEKTLWFAAITSSLLTCGLLIPVWTVVMLIYYIVKATSKPPVKPEPKIVMPSNEFASDWAFVIMEKNAPTSVDE